MKKILFLLISTVIIISFGCKKEDLITNASMSASINDTQWSSVTRLAKHFTNTKIITITGTSLSGEVLVITIRGDEAGTYNSSTSIDELSAQVGAVYQPDASSPTEDNYVSKSGTVTISDMDTDNQLISGTFSFEMSKLSETMSITDGKFEDIKYGESEE